MKAKEQNNKKMVKRRERAIAVSHGNEIENREHGQLDDENYKQKTRSTGDATNFLGQFLIFIERSAVDPRLFSFLPGFARSFVSRFLLFPVGRPAPFCFFQPTHARCWLIPHRYGKCTGHCVFFSIAFCSPYCCDRLVYCCSFLHASFFCFILLNLILHVWIAPSAQEKTLLR